MLSLSTGNSKQRSGTVYILANMFYNVNAGGNNMKSVLLIIGFIIFWIVLQKYILPHFGVST
jgi:hypothetical protein